LVTSGLAAEVRLEIIKWAEGEIKTRGWETDQFLEHIREQLRARILRETDEAGRRTPD